MKTCTKCQEAKPISEFWADRSKKNGYSSRCKVCKAAAYTQYRKDGDYDKKRYQKAPEKERERHLIRKYGVTLADYGRMFEAQGGACAVCGKTQDRAFDVDHCHTTGKVRGLLCTNCNRMVGHAHDDSARLRAAAEYLERSVVPQVSAAFVSAFGEATA